MTRSPRYVLPTHLCRFAVRAEGPLPRGLSGDLGLTRFASSASSGASPSRGTDFPVPRAALHHGGVQNPAEPPRSVAPSVVTVPLRCRNVCLLRFGYACRPRLSPRLTLGGLASPRKPRVYGGRVTLSSLATHASILARARSTARFPGRFAPARDAPLPMNLSSSRRFGTALSPVYCRRAPTRPVSCYALFEGVAASKPTSWLSARAHILCHSARIWGPWRAVWAVSLSSTQLSPHALTAGIWACGIRSSVRVGRRRSPLIDPVLYLRRRTPDASPKAISGGTRYLRV